MKKIKKYLYIILASIGLICTIFLLVYCSIPSDSGSSKSSSSKNSSEKFNGDEYLDGLNDTPEKNGILSEKEAATKGFSDAWYKGLIDVLMEDFPNTYNDITVSDMFLVNDAVDGDYYYVLGEYNGTAVAMATIDAVTGEILGAAILKPESEIILNKSSEVSRSIPDTYGSVAEIKPVFIGTVDDYDRLYQWKWAVILDKPTSRSSNRSVLLVTPFSTLKSATRSSALNKSSLPPGYKSRISVFSNLEDEKELLNYLSSTGSSRGSFSTNNDKPVKLQSLD